MSATLKRIHQLVASGGVRISLHGYEELAQDDISVRELFQGFDEAVLVEDYPDYPKGP